MKHLILLSMFFLIENLTFGQNSIDGNTKKMVIERLCKSFNDHYVYPEKAALMSVHIQQNHINGQYDAISQHHAFAGQITKDIRAVNHDKHIRIVYDPELEADIIQFLSSKKNADLISEADLKKEERRNFHFRKVEILPANMGYIELNGFAVPGKSASKAIAAAMQLVAHTDAVIFDFRNNFGGNGVVANEMLGYFFPNKQYIGRSYNRIENKWTDQFAGNTPKSTQKMTLQMPVYILTSKRTFSAAEGLAYHLQHLKNAMITGDTTRGGAHLTRSFSIGHGFVAFIPFCRGESAVTKTDWEGTGVIPDIAVKEENALLAAQLHFLQHKLQGQTDEEEQRKTKYVIHYLTSKTGIAMPSPQVTHSFVGNYEYFIVTYENNQLLFMDSKNYKVPVVMTPITRALYQIGHDYQVEFLLDEKGECHSIQMYWDDGWTENIKKTK